MLMLQFSLDINFWIMIFVNEADNSIHFLSDLILRAHFNNVASVCLCCFFFMIASSPVFVCDFFSIFNCIRNLTLKTQNNNKKIKPSNVTEIV